MANKIFNAILNEKIENFRMAFSNTSKEVFYDDSKNKIIHSLEYGTYRESVCKDFLKFIIPSRLKIDAGFIISSQNKSNSVSTQCDIVIYDATHTPLYKSGKEQRFFPVETVVSIGEIKSTLSRQQLKETINKLARIKAIRRNSDEINFVQRQANDPFDSYKHPFDNLFSFIICNSLSFNHRDLVTEFKALYEPGIDVMDRHNMILSVKDGIFLYKHIINGKILTFHYPFVQRKLLKNRYLAPGDSGNNHIETFANYMFMGTNSATVFSPDFTSYSGKFKEGLYIDEN